jgi:hypothetical protein
MVPSVLDHLPEFVGIDRTHLLVSVALVTVAILAMALVRVTIGTIESTWLELLIPVGAIAVATVVVAVTGWLLKQIRG